MAVLKAEFDLDLSGLDGLKKASQQRAVTLKGIKAAAKLVQQAAKAGAPKRKGSGTLRRSIGTLAKKGSKGKTLAFAVIGPRQKVRKEGVKTPYGGTVTAVPAYYAHLVEKGTRGHSIRAGSKLARRTQSAKGQAVVRHPGAKPNPFLKPAYESTRAAAGAAAERAMGEEIQKIIAKESAKLLAKKKKG